MGGRGKRKHKTLTQAALDAIALEDESDRACPLIALELLDEALEHAFRAKFTEVRLKEELQDQLLVSYRAMLFSFGAKVSICRAVGWLPHDTCKLLDAMREIRNHCGHHMRVATLEDEEIREKVRAIQTFVQEEHGYKRRPRPRKAIEKATWLLARKIATLQNSAKNT